MVMSHVALADAVERGAEAHKQPLGFAKRLTALNPFIWMQGNDPAAPGTLADSASAAFIGPGGQTWTTFPMPPPRHITLDTNPHWPLAPSGAGWTYQVPGATSDGATAFALAAGNPGPGWLTTSWAANNDAPMIAGTPVDVLLWFKWTGNTHNSRGGNDYGSVFGLGQQGPFGAIFVGKSLQNRWSLFARDTANVLQEYDFAAAATILDGNWHLLGHKVSGDQTHVRCDLYIDGALSESATLTASGASSIYGALNTSVFVAADADFYIDSGGGFSFQHLAILPNNGGSCDGVSAAQYAALYAAR